MNMNEVATEKTMTVKEVADVFGVSKDTVLNCIKRIMPDKLEHGKTTFLNEIEVAKISIELKRNVKVTEQLTVEAGSTVMSRTTRLEVLANYQRANEAFIAMLESEKSELQRQVEYLTPKAEIAETLIESDTLQDLQTVAVTIGLKNIFKVLSADKIIEKKKSEDFKDYYKPYAEYSKYFEVKNKPWVDDFGKSHSRPRIFVNAKGLAWLSKRYGTKQSLGGQNESRN